MFSIILSLSFLTLCVFMSSFANYRYMRVMNKWQKSQDDTIIKIFDLLDHIYELEKRRNND